jgi:eukaryotic-like serine/threonine-protein kinase
MPLSLGTRIGPYQLLGPLGAGGMGEVYRARDTKLEREVAIKVLPSAFATDPDRLIRFQREAKILAALNHPHIAQIYGMEENESAIALVMELVQGATLSVPQPLDRALDYARQIAMALEAAHEKGITHRDLKPGNIMVTPEGTVKVLDFGLAAIPAVPTTNGDLADSPTFTMPATQVGMIMGTAGYMSPEQASGKPVDRRSDIWSFGVVLWEMLTGEQLFRGETTSHTIADVLRARLDFDKLPASTPPLVANLLKRCLDRNVRTRLQAIGEARIALERYADPSYDWNQPAAPAAPSRGRTWFPWAVAAVFALAAALLGYLSYQHVREPAPKMMMTSILPPDGHSFADNTPPALSPDGRKLCFVAARDGKRLLWIRDLDSPEARSINGTEEANSPFWSPDSDSIGFFAGGKLKRVDVSGGAVMTLCATEGNSFGASWSPLGVIVFSNSPTSGLYRISATGGSPVAATTLDDAAGEVSHRLPWFLPDGRRFLFTVRSQSPGKEGVYAGDLDSTQKTLVVQEPGRAAYVPLGGILLLTPTPMRASPLMAYRFDLSRLRIGGEGYPLVHSVNHSPSVWAQHQFTVTRDGALVYAATAAPVRLTWRDRTGKVLGHVGEPDPERTTVAISPDGAMATADSGESGNPDLWLHDLKRGASSRFTFNSVGSGTRSSAWAPDGSAVLFALNSSSGYAIMRKALGGGAPQIVEKSWGRAPRTIATVRVSPDGRFIVARLNPGAGATGSDIWMMPMSPPGRKPEPLLETTANEGSPSISPGSDWLAYDSDETRRTEVYIQSFPTPGRKYQVSIHGGRLPVWSRNGKELYFIAPDMQMMAVAIENKGGRLEIGAPQGLFPSSIVTTSATNVSFDVSNDGRFLIPQQEHVSGLPLTLLVNWQSRMNAHGIAAP